jgi:phosphoenolpyruvate synthase/pyruvate phosphate dikinase
MFLVKSHHHDSEQQTGYRVSFLHQLPTNSPLLFGGKATNLARLHQYGIPIPRGFVIPTQGFIAFISACKQLESYTSLQLYQDDIEKLIQFAESFKNAASQYTIPKPVAGEIIKGFHQLRILQKGVDTSYAIRSSATTEDAEDFSFAGQADSFLCVSDPSSVMEAVKQTWLSLYSPRSILYLMTKGVQIDQVRMGVIIQEMIFGDVSGVMFTANVVNNDTHQLIIESTWGLGESIVAGKVTPDSFIIQKAPLEILEQHCGEKALYSVPYPENQPECTVLRETPIEKRQMLSLTNDQLLELAQLGLQIEQKMGSPQDIEWTYINGRFVILQTRPITTL